MSCKHGDYWYPIGIFQNGTIHQEENNFYGKNYTDDPTLQDFPEELYEPKKFEEKNCVFGNGEKTGMVFINDQAPPGSRMSTKSYIYLHFCDLFIGVRKLREHSTSTFRSHRRNFGSC